MADDRIADARAKLAELEREIIALQGQARPPQGLIGDLACPDCGAVHRWAFDRGTWRIADKVPGALPPPSAHERLMEARRERDKTMDWLRRNAT